MHGEIDMIDADPQTGLTQLPTQLPAGTAPFDVSRQRARFPFLPQGLFRVWSDHGLAALAGGRLHLMDPARLAPLMSHILEGDPDLGSDVAAIAYGNLGELVLWSGRHGYGFLSPVLATLEMPNLTAPRPEPPEAQFARQVLQMPAELIEAFDPDQQPVHDRLVATLGNLPPGAIYGTTPVPPPLGGTPVGHYVVAELMDWLEAVYTEIGITLVDWTREPAEIRPVGPPPVPEGTR